MRRLQSRLPGHAPRMAATIDGERLAELAELVARWETPSTESARIASARRILQGQFILLNEGRELRMPDWSARYGSPLWSYHLHYFDYAVDLAWAARATREAAFARRFEQLADGWIATTQPGVGIGWDPYVISVRAVNWLQAIALAGDHLQPPTRDRLVASIASQLTLLERRLEHHLRANHLLRNYRALLWGGLVLRGPRAPRWARVGFNGLCDELREQVLGDGAHYERSPMYHAIVLGDVLECLELCDRRGLVVPGDVRERAAGMVRALDVMSRPSGELHLFGDSAGDGAPSRQRLECIAVRVTPSAVRGGTRSVVLGESGYFAHGDTASGDRILVSCGEPSPTYQPGHAHCDLLSFELDLGGRPVIVDAGTSGYEGDPLRAYQRGTSAHNTVLVDDTDQSEMWGTFRVARRAQVVARRAAMDGGTWRFTGSYSPYHARHCVHERTIERRPDGEWRIQDSVSTAESVVSFVHLHPDFVAAVEGKSIRARASDGREVLISADGASSIVVERGQQDPPRGWYAPAFGVRLPCARIAMTIEPRWHRAFGYRVRAVGTS